jgi:hypothetical protein
MEMRGARHKAAAYAGKYKHRFKKEISTPRVGFEATIPVFKQVKDI